MLVITELNIKGKNITTRKQRYRETRKKISRGRNLNHGHSIWSSISETYSWFANIQLLSNNWEVLNSSRSADFRLARSENFTAHVDWWRSDFVAPAWVRIKAQLLRPLMTYLMAYVYILSLGRFPGLGWRRRCGTKMRSRGYEADNIRVADEETPDFRKQHGSPEVR